jgi:fucose 4-O-acetylase-like acetyltransferase
VQRNRYADLLRVGAIGMVVLGHWVLTDITYHGGQLSGLDVLDYVSWGRWVTLVFQVMPVFFLVGGYANATSLADHRAQGETWPTWVRGRVLRLLWPTAAYAAVAAAAVETAALAGAARSEIAEAAWVIALQLWFLPVYLLLIAATPVLLAAHQRWGLRVPAVMAAAAGLIDVAVVGLHVPVIGFAEYLLVWGSMHQWGFAWQDGSLTRPRWRPLALAGVGGVALVALVGWGPFPVDMIGAAGERVGNTTPPSVALLALAALQAGLLLALEQAGQRLLANARRWRLVSSLNSATMTVYLWHMAPVVLVAIAVYPDGLMPQPPLGSPEWWVLRLVWLAVLGAVLVPLTMAVMWLERPIARIPRGRMVQGAWRPAGLLAGIAAAAVGLARIAIAGFAPGGTLALGALAALGAGLVLTLLAGYPPDRPPRRHPPPDLAPGGQAGAGASGARPVSSSRPALAALPAAGRPRVARRSAGLTMPRIRAPATQTSPPLTTEIVSVNNCATSPASTLPSDGAELTWTRYRLATRPRSASGV